MRERDRSHGQLVRVSVVHVNTVTSSCRRRRADGLARPRRLSQTRLEEIGFGGRRPGL